MYFCILLDTNNNYYDIMKKLFLTLSFLAGMICCTTIAKAQSNPDTIDIPFGCFESWDSYPADTLSFGFFSIPVNYTYSLPRGWHVPVYSINETLSYSGFNIPINSNIPLAKVSEDSINAPQGHSALVAESFFFSDILDPMVYSLASSMLDSSLTHQVIPTIIANGTINLNNILPLFEMIYGNTEDLSWMLDMLDTIDINDYLQGGFALNGFDPAKLIGYYKYIYPEGDIRDNGAVVAIGTRYDTVTHRRMLVGAGSKNLYQLYDTVDYEPFEMDYTSLSAYFPADYDYYDADSMVVLVISSANDKLRLDGSRLFVDSLRLVSKPSPCGRIENFRVDSHNPYAVNLAWNNTAAPDSWEVEYGRKGFVQGRGVLSTVSDSTITITGLTMNTDYDFFVRGLCGDTATTEWVFLEFHTDQNPESCSLVSAEQVRIYPNPAQGSVQVHLNGTSSASIRLYSIEGRLVEQVSSISAESTIALPTKGLFLLEVVTPEGSFYQKITSL